MKDECVGMVWIGTERRMWWNAENMENIDKIEKKSTPTPNDRCNDETSNSMNKYCRTNKVIEDFLFLITQNAYLLGANII